MSAGREKVRERERGRRRWGECKEGSEGEREGGRGQCKEGREGEREGGKGEMGAEGTFATNSSSVVETSSPRPHALIIDAPTFCE